jgi:cold shock CspA family protein
MNDPTPPRQTGTLLHWSVRGFGFIKPDTGGKDIYVHSSQVRTRSADGRFVPPPLGARCSFLIGQTARGFFAIDVDFEYRLVNPTEMRP